MNIFELVSVSVAYHVLGWNTNTKTIANDTMSDVDDNKKSWLIDFDDFVKIKVNVENDLSKKLSSDNRKLTSSYYEE